MPLPRIDQNPPCPYAALKHAFNFVPAPLSGPACVVPAPKGPIPLTFGNFDSMLKSRAAAINLDPSQISGHSFRSGGATLAFQAQIPAEIIKQLGD